MQDSQESQESRQGANRRQRLLLLALAFAAGLFLGWMVIGWWLWPVQWTDSGPWDLRSDYRQTYVNLVAEEYWRGRDLARVRQNLAGWDETELAILLATMDARATSTEERQRLVLLKEVLALPDYQASMFLPRYWTKRPSCWGLVWRFRRY